MITDKKQLIVEVSERFKDDLKVLSVRTKKSMKQIVIEALVAYMNKIRSEKV